VIQKYIEYTNLNQARNGPYQRKSRGNTTQVNPQKNKKKKQKTIPKFSTSFLFVSVGNTKKTTKIKKKAKSLLNIQTPKVKKKGVAVSTTTP
jgi:hypothetical protein